MTTNCQRVLCAVVFATVLPGCSADSESGTPADGGSGTGGSGGFAGEGTPWVTPAPRATCGTGDVAETGVQGLGQDVRCNLTVGGQVAAPHFLSMAWHKNCAYVNGQTGTTVIDVSNSSSPTVVKTLTTTGMQTNWETMKVHEGRGLLVGYRCRG